MQISVVIPVFNKANTVRRAIESVLNQEGVDTQKIELVIINDGSTDYSLNVIHKVAAENRARNILIHSQANGGVSNARNAGCEIASADLICFLDADDTYLPCFVKTVLALNRQFKSADLLATGYFFVECDTGRRRLARSKALASRHKPHILDNFFDAAIKGDLPFCASSFAVRKTIIERLGGFPENENMGEDQDLFAKVALKSTIAYDPKPCCQYFKGVSGSLMNSVKVKREMPFSRRLQQQLMKGEIPAPMQQSVKRYIAGHLFDLTRRSLAQGELTTASTLVNDPRTRIHPLKRLYWQITVRVKTAQSKLKLG